MGRATKIGGFCSVAAWLVSTPAHADEPETKSYALQTLAADGASIATVVSGAAIGQTPGAAMSIVGVAGYALATPIIHGLHHNWDRAAGSLGMRVLGIPVATIGGALVGLAACPTPKTDGAAIAIGAVCAGVGGVAGAGLGAIVISAIDAVAFANEKVPRAPASGVTVAPTFDASARGASVGLGGSF